MIRKKDERDRLTFDLMGMRKRLEAVAFEPEQPVGSVLRAVALIGLEVVEVCRKVNISAPQIGQVEEWVKSLLVVKHPVATQEVAELIAPTGTQTLEEIALEENTTVNEAISLVVDVVLNEYPQIKESAEIKKRSFMTTLELWIHQGESGETAREFLKALSSNKRVSDASCIKVARELDVEPEEIIRLRNCVRDRQ